MTSSNRSYTKRGLGDTSQKQNRFYHNARRRALTKLKERHPEEYEALFGRAIAEGRAAMTYRVEKSQRLFQEGHVTELDPPRLFQVEGDHDVYRVLIGPGLFRWCECPFNGTCSHVLSAQAFITHENFKNDPIRGLPQG